MAFKLPQLPRRPVRSTSSVVCSGLPTFDYSNVKSKTEIGRGSFGNVCVAKYQDLSHASVCEVVIKEMFNLDEDGQKLFVKEAQLLSTACHSNIVAFKAVCNTPPAIMQEHMCFDFKPFQRELKVYSVKDLLAEIGDNCTEGFTHLMPVIAADATRGLAYLHENGIVHRDLKPSNLLVSNQHYSTLTNAADIEKAWSEKPVICKLTDFGESRSDLIHTQTLLESGTYFVNRGTPAFMAPEINLAERQKRQLSIADLKKVDIWALGLMFYSLCNPNLSSPYMYDLKITNAKPDNYRKIIQDMMRKRKLPSPVPKFLSEQESVWKNVYTAFTACVSFDVEKRPTAEEVLGILQVADAPTCRNIPLSLSLWICKMKKLPLPTCLERSVVLQAVWEKEKVQRVAQKWKRSVVLQAVWEKEKVQRVAQKWKRWIKPVYETEPISVSSTSEDGDSMSGKWDEAREGISRQMDEEQINVGVLPDTGKPSDKCPVFQKTSTGLGLREIFSVCLGDVPPSKVCTSVPSVVKESAVYVIDLESVDERDLTADDSGIYSRHSCPSRLVKVTFGDSGEIDDVSNVTKPSSTSNRGVFLVKRQYSWLSTNDDDYRRTIIKVVHEGQYLRYAIIQYVVKGDHSVIIHRSHGNRKGSDTEPFYRTKASVLDKIKSSSSTSAKRIVSIIEKNAGGLSV